MIHRVIAALFAIAAVVLLALLLTACAPPRALVVVPPTPTPAVLPPGCALSAAGLVEGTPVWLVAQVPGCPMLVEVHQGGPRLRVLRSRLIEAIRVSDATLDALPEGGQ